MKTITKLLKVGILCFFMFLFFACSSKDLNYSNHITNYNEGNIFTCDNDGYYFRSETDQYHLYKIDASTGERSMLASQIPGAIYPYKEYVYFENLSDHSKLYRVKKDGTGLIKLLDETADQLCFENEIFYYISGESFYSFHLISGNHKLIRDTGCLRLQTDGKRLYLIAENKTSMDESKDLIICNMQGKEQGNKIYSSFQDYSTDRGTKLYQGSIYQNMGRELIRTDLKNGSTEIIGKFENEISAYFLLGDKIVLKYVDGVRNNTGALWYEYDVQTKDLKELEKQAEEIPEIKNNLGAASDVFPCVTDEETVNKYLANDLTYEYAGADNENISIRLPQLKKLVNGADIINSSIQIILEDKIEEGKNYISSRDTEEGNRKGCRIGYYAFINEEYINVFYLQRFYEWGNLTEKRGTLLLYSAETGKQLDIYSQFNYITLADQKWICIYFMQSIGSSGSPANFEDAVTISLETGERISLEEFEDADNIMNKLINYKGTMYLDDMYFSKEDWKDHKKEFIEDWKEEPDRCYYGYYLFEGRLGILFDYYRTGRVRIAFEFEDIIDY